MFGKFKDVKYERPDLDAVKESIAKYMEDFMGEEGSVLLHMDQWVEISETGLEHPEMPSFPSSPISLDHNS